MYTTFSVVESILPLTSRRRRPVSFSSPQSSPSRSVHQSSSFVLFTSSKPVHARTLTSMFSSRTLSSRLTKSIPVPDPHLNLPSLPFRASCSVPISDDRWDTRAALRTTHTSRIWQSILWPSGLSTIVHLKATKNRSSPESVADP